MPYDYGRKKVSKALGLTGVQSGHIVRKLKEKNIDPEVFDWEGAISDAKDYGDRYSATKDKLKDYYGIDIEDNSGDFNKYSDIVHIVHKFTYDTHDSTFINYDINNIDHSYIKTNALFLLIKVRKMTSITNGNIAIRKNIYEKLNWYNDIRRGQDVKFNSDIYTKYKKSLYIKIPLLNYKYLLSTK